MAMKIRKYGDVLDGAPEMHVDPHYHNPAFNATSQTFPLSMAESTSTNKPHGNQCNDDEWWDIRNTWDRVSGLLTPLVDLVHWPLEWNSNIIGCFLCDRPLYPLINWLIPVSCASRSEFICHFTPNVFPNDLSISFRLMKHCLTIFFAAFSFHYHSLWSLYGTQNSSPCIL